MKSNRVLNGFEFGKILGKGKFGLVQLARHNESGFIVAIKKIEKAKIK
jgi:aurora kinase